MSRGINKVILVGNVGVNPELRHTPNDSAVTQLSIATSESWKDKNTGETQERTEWHKVVLFNRLAEIAAEYVKKGSKIYIEGSLKTRKWTDNAGVEKYTTEVIASELQLLDSRNQSSSSESMYPSSEPSKQNTTSAKASDTQHGFDNIEDDIPF